MVDKLSEILEQNIHFVENFRHFDFGNGRIFLLENLRFETGEEENGEAFAQELSSLSDIYINEAFAVSHRRHASVYALPIEFKKAGKECGLGLRFLEEIENLSRVFVKPKRPVVAIISGVKEDKLKLAEKFENIADKVLIGGKVADISNRE
jgi:phosphoglycerate kinase